MRRLIVLGGVALVLWGLIAALGALWALVTAPRPLELPRGGREVFPKYRLFGYSGHPRSEALGRLGIGTLPERMAEIEEKGKEFAGDRKILPVMELIAVTAHGSAGDDGLYRSRISDETIQTWLDQARTSKAILLLNIQPGRSTFMDEVKYFEKWLVQPDVGVALDPEWAVSGTEVPGKVFGHTTGQDLDAVSSYLAGLVTEHKLPQKVMVYHQLHEQIVSDEKALQPRPEIALVKSIDGIGSPAAKTQTWERIVARTPEHVHRGFKLFFVEDTRKNRPLMTAEQVLELEPTPEYVLFE